MDIVQTYQDFLSRYLWLRNDWTEYLAIKQGLQRVQNTIRENGSHDLIKRSTATR